MEGDFFAISCELIRKKLVDLKVNLVSNSVGSNVFFRFGAQKEQVFKNGRKRLRSEWTIWISMASWRLEQKNRYIVGSGDIPQDINSNIQKLLGKRFLSFRFLSQFLDVEFNFEDGYQLTTFFNCLYEDQWIVLLPNETSISIDCSSCEKIKNVQSIAANFPINESYKTIDPPQKNIKIAEITYDEYEQPILHFDNGFLIILRSCAWRLEKDQEYLIGCLDDDRTRTIDIMDSLIGKQLENLSVANAMMDARLQFSDGYVLKTFTCCPRTTPWKILSGSESIFEANIQLFES